ncbi:MAG: diacylglycerol kinase family lipid kinase [Actinobacteria bacterium]|nr:diacylglycerol kinase family lipid kinase [Actinomycetota bacterium]
MLTDNAGRIAIGAIVLLLVLAWLLSSASGETVAQAVGIRRFGRHRPPREHFRPEGAGKSEAPRRVAAIIVNPTKFDNIEAVRARVTKGCLAAGWDQPLWMETTAQDPGTGQARQAVTDGATLICPLGGDGTVRAVAAALVGTETPIGLLPRGTGNLLARNLNLPVDSLDEALKVALTGQNKRVDVGRLTVDLSGEHERPEEHIFLIMAGIGFDAAIMADAPERLKKTVGPLAYTFSGAKNLRGPQFKVRIKIDDESEISRRTRSVVIGNCGKLTGGLVLMPRAEIDDGWLDAVILSPVGVVGWVAVAGRVISQKRKGHQRVDHHRLRSVAIRCDQPVAVQVDGDTIGQARALSATVDPLALIVRVG